MNKSEKELVEKYIDKRGGDALKELLKNDLQSKKMKRKGPWPARMGWWQKNKNLQAVAKKYKYLTPLLNELKNHKALHQDKNEILGVEPFVEFGKEKKYVLLDLSKSRAGIADRIGCSETTVGNYIRGLVECDLMVFFDKGRRTFYSMAEWGIMPSDQDKEEFVPRKLFWLTEAMSSKLVIFKPQYK